MQGRHGARARGVRAALVQPAGQQVGGSQGLIDTMQSLLSVLKGKESRFNQSLPGVRAAMVRPAGHQVRGRQGFNSIRHWKPSGCQPSSRFTHKIQSVITTLEKRRKTGYVKGSSRPENPLVRSNKCGLAGEERTRTSEVFPDLFWRTESILSYDGEDERVARTGQEYSHSAASPAGQEVSGRKRQANFHLRLS